MSGSFVLRSGVGTQMFIVSRSRITEKSVVASKPPACAQRATSAVGTSGMYEWPALTSSTLRWSRSMPMVSSRRGRTRRRAAGRRSQGRRRRRARCGSDLREEGGGGSVHCDFQAPVSGSVIPNSTRRKRSHQPSGCTDNVGCSAARGRRSASHTHWHRRRRRCADGSPPAAGTAGPRRAAGATRR